jgi:hypothetical protein
MLNQLMHKVCLEPVVHTNFQAKMSSVLAGFAVFLVAAMFTLTSCPNDVTGETIYVITVMPDIPGGSISASPASGPAGTTVTLSNTPASGYVFGYYIVNGVQITGNSFALDGNVTVSAVFNRESNLMIPIGSPSVILYLNGGTTPLVEDGRTNVGNTSPETYTVSIANGSYSQIIWYLNGRVVSRATDVSIILSKQSPGVYLVTVEAVLTGGDRNTGSHTFVVE